MPAPRITDHLGAIAKALGRLRVRWYVFGAQAVIAAGAVRQTADIDITTEDIPVTKLIKALRSAGYGLRRGIAGIEDLVEHHRILPLEHRKTGLQLDVVRAGPGPEEQMLERVLFRRVGRRLIPFIDTNDLLVLKVLAGREKDLEDVRALLRSRSPEIDIATVKARLRHMAALLDDSTLLDLFEQQRKRASASQGGRDGRQKR